MSAAIRHMDLPLREADVRSLALGDMVTLSGLLFTGRSRFHIRAVEDDVLPPIDFAAANAFFHVGPVMREGAGGWEVVSAEPTSSIRFERYGGDVVRKLGLRALIGKTTMGPGTAAALRDVGCVHLTKVGLCGNQLASQITGVRGVHFLEELGKTEATWLFQVQRFGPFMVDMDTKGNNYFEQLEQRLAGRMTDVLRQLGVPEDFVFTPVDAE